MASMVLCFSPNAMARPRTQNPGRYTKKKSFGNPKHNPKFKKQISTYRSPPEPVTLPGGDATTYTRLPPKDDFAAPSLNPSSEVKLSESVSPTVEEEMDELASEKEGEDDNEALYGDVGKDEKFEVFEGNYDSEFDDDGEEDEILGFGKYVKFVDNYVGGESLEHGNGEPMCFSGGEGDVEEDNVKEKGVPAVMRCFDTAKIYVKAGNGGNGVVAFRREKYVPLGGPSGGDGGRGGNVYIEVDGSMNSLLPFRNGVHFRAGRGSHGQGKMQAGAKGEDVVVKVAPGTVIREAGQDEVLLEMLYPGQRALLLPGGRGGRGNAAFKSGTNKVPRIAENGEEGPEM